MNSILTSIKKLLGIPEDFTEFDIDIIMHINSVLLILSQIGVGPADPLIITDKSNTWDQLLIGSNKLEFVKSYVYMKVRMMFDPPSGAANEAMKNMITELEWRISVTVDPS